MSIAQSLIPELKHETGLARKVVERVPLDKFDWKPHEKSMPFGRLASHVAEIPGWVEMTVAQDTLEFESGSFQPFVATTPEEMLTTIDDKLAKGVALLEDASDQLIMKHWQMIVDGNTLIDMPKIAVLRVWVLNHMIHHRGQLTVYLRENDIPVPSIYGPSADEQE